MFLLPVFVMVAGVTMMVLGSSPKAAEELGSLDTSKVRIALAGLPVWLWLGQHPAARAALAGINAAVVGVLGAALYNPIWLSAVSMAAMSQ